MCERKKKEKEWMSSHWHVRCCGSYWKEMLVSLCLPICQHTNPKWQSPPGDQGKSLRHLQQPTTWACHIYNNNLGGGLAGVSYPSCCACCCCSAHQACQPNASCGKPPSFVRHRHLELLVIIESERGFVIRHEDSLQRACIFAWFTRICERVMETALLDGDYF